MNDDLLGLICFGLTLNTFIFAPIGAVIGHFAKNRWRDGAGLGFLIGPLGYLFIFMLRERPKNPSVEYQAERRGATPNVPTRVPDRQPSLPTATLKHGRLMCRKCEAEAVATVEMGVNIYACPRCGMRLTI
jgi:hypothetical protein